MKRGLFGFFFLTAVFMVMMAFVPSDSREHLTLKHRRHVKAVITRIEDKKAYVKYTYNGAAYESALNFYNRFTMAQGKELTVYIDPKTPDMPMVPKRWFRWSIILIILAVFEIWDAVGKMMYDPRKSAD